MAHCYAQKDPGALSSTGIFSYPYNIIRIRYAVSAMNKY